MKKFLIVFLLAISVSVTGVLTSEVNGAAKSITVSNSREFLEALGSDRIIKMKPGNYILSEWDPFLNNRPEQAPRYANIKDKGKLKLAKGVTWSDDPFDGGELILNGIKNLTINSVNDKGPAGNLIVDPRYAFVMKFVKCSNITIRNITAGHSEGGYCSGGVFEFTDSSKITITDTNMYGCGTEGLVLLNVSDMKVASSMIYECTYDIMAVSGGKNIVFEECIFSDNREFTLITISETKNISFTKCKFIDNRGEMFSVRDTTVLVSNSTFERNITEYPIKNSNNISFKECTFD